MDGDHKMEIGLSGMTAFSEFGVIFDGQATECIGVNFRVDWLVLQDNAILIHLEFAIMTCYSRLFYQVPHKRVL